MANDRTGSRTLLLGTGEFATQLAAVIKDQSQSSYDLVGAVSVQTPASGWCDNVPIIGSAEELTNIIMRMDAERVIVAMPNRSELLPDHQLIEARISNDVIVEDGEEVYEKLTGKLRIEALEPRHMIFNKELRPSRLESALARIFSLACALPALIMLAPLLALIAIAVKMDSNGPALFVQERVGLGGKPFSLLKFRTMRPEENRVSEWAGDNSHRITKVGRILRKYRLDELPQLLNVLRGDMNIVGPRPHPASNFRMFVLVSRNTPECGLQIPYYSLRSTVRPGITGWAQVRYQYANNLGEEIEKLRFDLYYVKHYSILLDLRILLETISVVFFGREFATETNPNAETPEDTEAMEAMNAIDAMDAADITALSDVPEPRPRLTSVTASGETPAPFQPNKRVAPRS